MLKGNIVTLHSNFFARSMGHMRQTMNFLGHRMRHSEPQKKGNFRDIYESAVSEAFNPKKSFIVTGAPHANAYYPRNFAWFYPDLLDPVTIVSEEDAKNRVLLLVRSIDLMCKAVRQGIHTTTLVPITKRKLVGIDYFSKPSDSLLGILAALRQLIRANSRRGYEDIFADASRQGKILLSEYREDLVAAIKKLAGELSSNVIEDSECLLCDAQKPYSAATDARAERARFVTNANIWTTFSWAVQLHIVSEESITRFLGRSLETYKLELLKTFAPEGYIQHSLASRAASPARRISIDFAHVREGFWNFQNEKERKIFARTADIILRESTFKTLDSGLYLVSIQNPKSSIIHLLTMPSYQGKAAWPAYNVGFAEKLVELAKYSPGYEEEAEKILCSIRALIETHGGYPEVVSHAGMPYRTWAYQSAVAHSWLPRFVSVWYKAFGTTI